MLRHPCGPIQSRLGAGGARRLALNHVNYDEPPGSKRTDAIDTAVFGNKTQAYRSNPGRPLAVIKRAKEEPPACWPYREDKAMPRVNKSFVLILLPFVFVWPASAANDTAHDEHLAAKYGLRVPPASREIPPAPDWIRQAEIVSSSAAVWEGYEFLLKETPVTRLVRARSGHTRMRLSDYYPEEKVSGLDAESVSGILLLSHVPHSADAFRLAHEHGIKAIPYLHFMCVHTNYADQDIFYFEHPEILMKDDKGHWVHTGMDGSDRLHRFRTCANPSRMVMELAE